MPVPATNNRFNEPEVAVLFDEFTAIWDAVDPTLTDWLTQALGTARYDRGLDIGCGTGRHTGLLASHCKDTIGVEPSMAMLHVAHQRHSEDCLAYILGSVLDLDPALVGQFDVVFSAFTLHHAGPLQQVLPHVASLIAPGGLLIVVDVVRDTRDDWSDRSFHRERGLNLAHTVMQLTNDRKKADRVVELWSHPAWLDAVAADTPLTQDEFHQQYGATFPGAAFYELMSYTAGLVWHAPTLD